MYGGDSDIAVVSLQVFPFVCQDRTGDVVDISVVGEVCGYYVE